MLTAFVRNIGVGAILAILITNSIAVNAADLRGRAPEGALPTRVGALVITTLIVRFEVLCMAVGVTCLLC
jgi:hypothetical protein